MMAPHDPVQEVIRKIILQILNAFLLLIAFYELKNRDFWGVQ